MKYGSETLAPKFPRELLDLLDCSHRLMLKHTTTNQSLKPLEKQTKDMPRVSLRSKRINALRKVVAQRTRRRLMRRRAGVDDEMEDCMDLMLTRRLRRLESNRYLF